MHRCLHFSVYSRVGSFPDHAIEFALPGFTGQMAQGCWNTQDVQPSLYPAPLEHYGSTTGKWNETPGHVGLLLALSLLLVGKYMPVTTQCCSGSKMLAPWKFTHGIDASAASPELEVKLLHPILPFGSFVPGSSYGFYRWHHLLSQPAFTSTQIARSPAHPSNSKRPCCRRNSNGWSCRRGSSNCVLK